MGKTNYPMNSTNIYNFTYDYLHKIAPDGVNIDKYLTPTNKPSSLSDVFARFVESAQNYQMLPSVIQYHKRKPQIEKILRGYNPSEVIKYTENELYYIFRKTFDVHSPDSKRNSWYKWSCSIVDSAKLLNNFNDFADFDSFVNTFAYNSLSSMALPLLLQSQIRGIGFALACDTLKELGYEQYPKPDVHLIDIFSGCEICEPNQIAVFTSIIQLAKSCVKAGINTTPYKLDKMFWLICSGVYYLDNIRIKGHKEEFIEELKSLISKQ